MDGLSVASCDVHNFSDQVVQFRFNGIKYEFDPDEIAYGVPGDVASCIEDSQGHYGLAQVVHDPAASPAERKRTIDTVRLQALTRMLNKVVEWSTFAEATVRDHGDRHALHPNHDHRERMKVRLEEVNALIKAAPKVKVAAAPKGKRLSDKPAPKAKKNNLGSATSAQAPHVTSQDAADAAAFA